MKRPNGTYPPPRGRAGQAALLLAAALGTAVPAAARAATPGPAASADPLTEVRIIERVTAALDRAMDYMAEAQKPDGSWFGNNAVNALALLAFMGRGHVPGRGPYRDVLERGKRFILSCQDENGVIIRGGQMYEHGLATLALAELYGMDPDPRLEEGLRKAVDLIVRAQSPSGGWRYQPRPGDQDMSVTVMQVVALRAANNAEIPVPEDTVRRALDYVRTCVAPAGGFSYTAGGGANPQMSAAGVLCLQLFGQYEDERIAPALRYLGGIPVQWGTGGGVSYFHYFHYYAIQAHYQAGGRWWNEWHPRIRDVLLERQNPDGSWDSAPGSSQEANAGVVGPDRIYPTAMNCLVLEIYNHFLPAYQR